VFKYSRYFIFSVYIAPRESNADFHNTLDELSNAVRDLGGNCIIADDFNAKSTLWGSPHSDWRSLALERWAAELELRLINSDASPTCVRFNGASVIDLTWSSAGICNLLSDWRVLSDEVSLSDHRYIVFRIGDAHDGRIFRHAHHMRWNTRSLDRELFGEIILWLLEGGFPVDSVEGLSLHDISR